eukprot:symbB.v1.2.024063.t1/scaffold2252.1/size84356/4
MSEKTGAFVHGPGKALATFEGKDYGPDYLSIEAGESVTLIPQEGEDSRWAFARVAGGRCGLIPRKFWKSDADREPPNLPRTERRSCDSCDCDELRNQIEAMRQHIEGLRKLSHESGKEPGTFRIVKKDVEERCYLVEATLPGTNLTQQLKWYFDFE